MGYQSESSASAPPSGGVVFEVRICYCGQAAIMRTSWSSKNPGRRYYKCAIRSLSPTEGCDYYDWIDPSKENGCHRCASITEDLKGAEGEVQTLLAAMSDMKKHEVLHLNVVYFLCGVLVLLMLCLVGVVGRIF